MIERDLSRNIAFNNDLDIKTALHYCIQRKIHIFNFMNIILKIL